MIGRPFESSERMHQQCDAPYSRLVTADSSKELPAIVRWEITMCGITRREEITRWDASSTR